MNIEDIERRYNNLAHDAYELDDDKIESMWDLLGDMLAVLREYQTEINGKSLSIVWFNKEIARLRAAIEKARKTLEKAND